MRYEILNLTDDEGRVVEVWDPIVPEEGGVLAKAKFFARGVFVQEIEGQITRIVPLRAALPDAKDLDEAFEACEEAIELEAEKMKQPRIIRMTSPSGIVH